MRIKVYVVLFITLLAGIPSSYAAENENIYTLYRDSPYLKKLYLEGVSHYSDWQDWQRVHIATFDSNATDPAYNKFMCERVKGFFEKELEPKPYEGSIFWCEKGRYKKE